MRSLLAGIDLDTSLAFYTPKVVKIRDRYLGAFYYFCFVSVILYIIGYAVLWRRGYLRFDDIVGTTRVLLTNPPSGFANLTRKQYCGNPTPCQLWDEHDVRYPNQDSNALLFTSMVTECQQRLLCSGMDLCNEPSPFSNVNCADASAPNTSTFFVAGLEDFGVTINHTVVAPNIFAATQSSHYRAKSVEMPGTVVQRDSSGAKQVIRRIAIGEPDLFTVDELLQFAGLAFDASLPGAHRNVRSTGCVIFAYIRYSNAHSVWSRSNEIRYEYEFMGGIDPEVLYVPQTAPTPLTDRYARTLVVRRGVKLLLLQEGSLSIFDTQVLLLTLVTGLGLLAGAQVCAAATTCHLHGCASPPPSRLAVNFPSPTISHHLPPSCLAVHRRYCGGVHDALEAGISLKQVRAYQAV